MKIKTEQERAIWAMFYANLVAMERHPGKREQTKSLADLALIADAMLQHYQLRQETPPCQP